MKIIRLPAQLNLPFQFKELLRIVICGALALQLSFTPFLAATSATNSAAIPRAEDSQALPRVRWALTAREHNPRAPAFCNVNTLAAVRAEEEDRSPDFSKGAPQVHAGEPPKPAAFDRVAWEGEVRRLSAAFRKYPGVYFASVVLQVQTSTVRDRKSTRLNSSHT